MKLDFGYTRHIVSTETCESDTIRNREISEINSSGVCIFTRGNNESINRAIRVKIRGFHTRDTWRNRIHSECTGGDIRCCISEGVDRSYNNMSGIGIDRWERETIRSSIWKPSGDLYNRPHEIIRECNRIRRERSSTRGYLCRIPCDGHILSTFTNRRECKSKDIACNDWTTLIERYREILGTGIRSFIRSIRCGYNDRICTLIGICNRSSEIIRKMSVTVGSSCKKFGGCIGPVSSVPVVTSFLDFYGYRTYGRSSIGGGTGDLKRIGNITSNSARACGEGGWYDVSDVTMSNRVGNISCLIGGGNDELVGFGILYSWCDVGGCGIGARIGSTEYCGIRTEDIGNISAHPTASVDVGSAVGGIAEDIGNGLEI